MRVDNKRRAADGDESINGIILSLARVLSALRVVLQVRETIPTAAAPGMAGCH